MHIFIVGDKNIGKTHLINRIIQNIKQPVFGFRTVKEAEDAEGYAGVYIHSVTGPRTFTEKNLVAICTREEARGNTMVFDQAGVSLLADIPGNAVVLMDELGFIETNAHDFCRRVLQIMDGDLPVIAAVKTKDTPFLQRVRSHQNALVYSITLDNRDALFAQISDDLKRLDPSSPFLSSIENSGALPFREG